MALDPFARRFDERDQREEARLETRDSEIDYELEHINAQRQRDGYLPDDEWERVQDLLREQRGIAKKLGGPRPVIERQPDEFDLAEVDADHIHILEWHVGQTTDRRCPKCGNTMSLRLNPQPEYYCHGRFRLSRDPKRCTFTMPVTNADRGALVPSGNEALAMTREEMTRKAYDRSYAQEIGQDLRELHSSRRVFHDYTCPIHGVGMVLARTNDYGKALGGWELRCPHPFSHYNSGVRCGYRLKLNTPAQVLAVRQSGTGKVF